MKTSTTLCPYFLFILACILGSCISMHCVWSQSLSDQKSLLFELRASLDFDHSASTKLVTWNATKDCCHWNGIKCNSSGGHVIGLDLSYEAINGGIDDSSSLFRLKFLQNLNLASCGLSGTLPEKLFQMRMLTSLDLSGNSMLHGTLPVFFECLYLQELALSDTNFSGSLPNSIGDLHRLRILDLSNSSLQGSIPSSIGSLHQLEHLDLSYNSLNGSLTSIDWKCLRNLKFVDLSQNLLSANIPRSILQLRGLQVLSLVGNSFIGTLQLNEILQSLKSLGYLDLSNNLLSIDVDDEASSTFASYPQLLVLYLASCNLRVVPKFLKTQTYLGFLDLSNNHIQGTVPKWIWKIGNGSLSDLNLSCNNFVDLERPIPYVSYLQYLDVHSNNLQGELPSVLTDEGSIEYLDWSNNSFTSIHPDIGDSLSSALFLSLAKNYINGRIPTSLCNAAQLYILDMEDNHLQGTIPNCLIAMTHSLGVLNLKGNNFGGAIPNEFGNGCSLETLNFNGNFLQGQIPGSLANCKELKVLDLGNIQFNDVFPCKLKRLSKLQVLVLRSNQLSGSIVCLETIIWPLLQILDIALNRFSDELKSQYVSKWTSMMAEMNKTQSEVKILQYQPTDFRTILYQDTVTVTSKGNHFELEKILTIFTSIDLSANAFYGEIPKELGNLTGLVVLNLSHNSLSGHIPSSFGNLSQLESLDLSCNALTGNIPTELVKLNFLEYLNLSFNKLEGSIPTGTQLQTFDASSYEGNEGLYGPPLTPISTRNRHAPVLTPSATLEGSPWSSKSEVEWMVRGAEVGFPVGLTIFIGPLLYIKRWRGWWSNHVERVVMKMLGWEDKSRRRSNRIQQQQRRHN